MKHIGATMEFSEERMDDLMRAYDEYISSCDYIRMSEVYDRIVNMPSERFWVSDIRATNVICSMMRGCMLGNMRPLKREMFEEIFNRVVSMRQKYPDMTVSACCSVVVAQPAPKFYLAPGSAKVMICKARKRWIREKMKRLRLL